MEINTVVLGLGSNLGDRLETLRTAYQLIEERIGKVVRTSLVYESEPHGFIAESSFYNACVLVETELNEVKVLEMIDSIESNLGRIRGNGEGYLSRTIDLDILFFNNQVIETATLQIPHPRIPERKFVLQPLNDLDPQYIHPTFGLPIHTLLEQCPDDSELLTTPHSLNV